MSYGRSTWSGGVGAIASLGAVTAKRSHTSNSPAAMLARLRVAKPVTTQNVATHAPGRPTQNVQIKRVAAAVAPSSSSSSSSSGGGGNGGHGRGPRAQFNSDTALPPTTGVVPPSPIPLPIASIQPSSGGGGGVAKILNSPPPEFLDVAIGPVPEPVPRPGMTTKTKVGVGIAAGLGLLYLAFGPK